MDAEWKSRKGEEESLTWKRMAIKCLNLLYINDISLVLGKLQKLAAYAGLLFYGRRACWLAFCR